MSTPLLLTHIAALARRIAPTCCADTGCGWYHGAWPLWRILDIGSTPWAHLAFYRASIDAALQAGSGDRVLISGAADQAMVAVVVDAFGQLGRTPDLTLVDRCETPLRLCTEWASTAGVSLKTTQADLATFTGDRPFDLVCTHSFLGYFDPAARAQLMHTWHRNLTENGRVITVNRLRPGAQAGSIGFTPEQSAGFLSRTEAGLAALSAVASAAEVRKAAQEWTSRFQTWPVQSSQALEALCAQAGFTAAIEVVDGGASRPKGPGSPGGARFAHLVAQK